MEIVLTWIIGFVVEILFAGVIEAVMLAVTKVVDEILKMFSKALSQRQWWFLFAIFSALGLSIGFASRYNFFG